MKTILHTHTLIYYDGILLFEARDPIGRHYIASQIDEVDGLDRYAVVGVSPDSLRRFRAGLLDLRSLMLEMPDGEWYIARPTADVDTPIDLEPQTARLEETEYLPDDGLVLYDDFIDDLAIEESRSRGNTVFEFSVEPPEAAAEHRVRADTLSDLLARIQRLVKYSYESVLRDLPKQAKLDIDTTNAPLMDVVVPAAPGSFRVVFESSSRPDMFGRAELARALTRMDEVFECAMYPDEAIERLMPHKGYLAKAYIDLLKFLAAQDTGLRYSWANPDSSHPQHGGVSGGDAKRISALLELAASRLEEVTIVGEFVRVNRSAGSWGLQTDDGLKTGKVDNDRDILNGLRVGARYRFDCKEEIEKDAMGDEKSTLYVKSIAQA